jgi:hypothetical protein
MHMQIAAGLLRLGHDVHYFETTSSWPYDPVRQTCVNECHYALAYLERVADSFGLGNRWAYRRSLGDKAWFGLSRAAAENLLAHADAVLNISGSTKLAEEGLKVGRLVYVGTDPVAHEIGYPKLVRIASQIGPGATELGCHPAAAADLDTMYATERLTELATLCDARVRQAIAEMGIQLKSFAGWRSYAGARA